MTKYQTFKIISSEIDKLNRLIDMKIIKGTTYKAEARKHKELYTKLRRLSSGAGWFDLRVFS
ncbi:hypothetical protein HYT01_01610 [Candidatus Giovannonibacteria bacterium]|nr:hypothetical protein [Candidatus Giovannonibacteria bacterium]